MVSKALKKWHLLSALNGKVEGKRQRQGEKTLEMEYLVCSRKRNIRQKIEPISSVKWAWKLLKLCKVQCQLQGSVQYYVKVTHHCYHFSVSGHYTKAERRLCEK